ncbi:MAG: DUF4091 domain-containing protein [Bacteroidales bacterium]|jgi:hypothetical protein|nr:DUF4091 domain-containing protein [Bacteroidales bacterium]
MKWYYLILCLFFFACSESRPLKNCETYAEAQDPSPDVNADWNKVSRKLNVSFGSIDERYARSSIPALDHVDTWNGSGWRGERLSAQVVLWSKEPVEQIECEFTDFRSPEATLNASVAQARFVRYVLTDIFEPGCGHRKPKDFPSSLSPDMLDSISCFQMEAQTTRPVWLSFDIPENAQPGIYAGTLKIYARNQKTHLLNINLEVLPQTLPAPKEWEFYLDLWQHPSAVARVHGVKPWSEEHWTLLKAPMAMLASAGQKVITANINKDPWNNQCYDAYEDMIIWTRQANGTWSYDYTIFDRWVKFMMDLGVKKVINCYSMIPWNNELHYLDAKKNELVNISAKPGTKEFNDIWTPFLKDFRKHLETKGWLEITNIAMDERSPKDMKATIDLLKKVAPEFGIALADNHKSYREYPFLKDICISFGGDNFDKEDLDFRKQNNLISTYYVCCSHKFPNMFTFSDPAEATYIGWHTVGSGLDGFLHWAYNSWTENPVIDSRFRTWPAGDTYLIYPGERSSIRFERLREGVQDAEKIRILREKLMLSSKADAPDQLTKLNEEVAKFGINKMLSEPCSDMLNRAKRMLEELSR